VASFLRVVARLRSYGTFRSLVKRAPYLFLAAFVKAFSRTGVRSYPVFREWTIVL